MMALKVIATILDVVLALMIALTDKETSSVKFISFIFLVVLALNLALVWH